MMITGRVKTTPTTAIMKTEPMSPKRGKQKSANLFNLFKVWTREEAIEVERKSHLRGESLYLGYIGIRVKDLERSLKFYQGIFGLEEVARGDNSKFGAGIFVLLRDRKSGMKLELN